MLKSSIHIILIVSVFLSAGGFWTNNHFCENELTKSSFFGVFGSCCSIEASPCSAEKMSCINEEHDDNCCDNKPSFHKLDQDQLLAKTEFKSFEQFELFNCILPSKNIQFSIADRNNLKYHKYLPPPIVFDYQVRLQTFLC